MRKNGRKKSFRLFLLTRLWGYHSLFILTLIITTSLQVIGQTVPEKISLHYDEVPLLEAIQDVNRQTGRMLLFKNEEIAKENVPVTIHLEDVTPMEGINRLLHGIDLTAVDKNGIIVISPVKTKELPDPVFLQGIVVDENNQPIPGVTVVVKGTTFGFATDTDGRFETTYQPQSDRFTLVFSFIGMSRKEVEYTGQKEIKVVLEEEVQEIEETVITGIFQKSRESYTGSVSVITEKDLKNYGSRSVLTTIRNLDPSFNILPNNDMGSNPNQLPEVQIRGASNLPDLNQLDNLYQARAELNSPLIIMDGFEISLQRLMDLDDNEVESITLLKDAASTALYGSRGTNGVIVVITKTPQEGRIKITYSGSLNLEVPDLSDYDLLKSRDKLALEKESGYYDYGNTHYYIALQKRYNKVLADIDRGVETYWLSKPLRTGVGHKHNIKLEGGEASFRYSLALQYNNIAGVMKESSRNNFNGSLNLYYTHNKVTFRNNLSIGVNKEKNSPYGSFADYVKQNPYWTTHDEHGKVKKILDDEARYWMASLPTNPLYNASLNVQDTEDYTNITNTFNIEWRPVPEFFGNIRFGISKQEGHYDDFKPADHTDFANYSLEDIFRKGKYKYGIQEDVNYNLAVTGNYSKTFADKHILYGGLNFELAEYKTKGYNFIVEGFVHESLNFLSSALFYEKDSKPTGSEAKTRRVGFVGNVNYSYMDRYFVDGSFRMDGSSLYGKDKHFDNFWSVGAGWNIHRESFMSGVTFLDRLKLRGSIGETGSTKFKSYEALATYEYYAKDRYKEWRGTKQKALGNPDLTWQKTLKYNTGLETNLFNSKLNMTIDIYLEQTRGLISNMAVPLSNGFSSYVANIGKVENRGIELRVTGFLVRNTAKRVIWSVTGMATYNKDKIVRLSDAMKKEMDRQLLKENKNPNRIWREGDSQYSIYAVPSLGIDPSTGKEMFLKANGEVTYEWIANDRIHCGIDQPKVRGNLNSMFRYKNAELNLSFGYRWGGQVYNSTLVDKIENANKYFNVDKRVFKNRWREKGDNAFFKGINDRTPTNSTSRFVQDEAVFECQNINISYEFREINKLKEIAGISSITLRGNAENLFRISTIKQERGITYPFARQFSFSLTAIF